MTKDNFEKLMIKFRYVILDDFDNVVEILYESSEYPDRWDSKLSKEMYRVLLDLDIRFNFVDYDNCPNVVVQLFENGEWKHYSDAVDDYYNL